MEIKVAKALLEDARILKKLYDDCYAEIADKSNKVLWNKETKQWDLVDPEGDKVRQEKASSALNDYYSAQKKFLNYIGNLIEIKEPHNIIGGRATTGYRGKLDGFDVNDLTNIWLSEKKQEGDVVMPYKFSLEGKATKINESRKYRIKRIDNKVYLMTSIEYFI